MSVPITGAPAGARSDSRRVEALWLDVLQRITSRAAHELKGALNGASVNLEVVRSRAESGKSDAEAVARYATAAAAQLEAVIAMSDALLALARAARETVGKTPVGEEIPAMMRRMVALVAPALRINERTLAVVEPLAPVNTSAVSPMLVRAVIGASLLGATEHWSHALCRLDAAGNRVIVEREGVSAGDDTVMLEQEMLDAAADAGIQVRTDGSAISMTFPLGTGGRNTGMAS